jgi:hypothetical protein
MSESGDKAEDILRELAELLASPQIPVQKRIAEELEVDQPFVSRAACGLLRRVTPRVVRLHEYANMRAGGLEAARRAAAEMDAEVAGSRTRSTPRHGRSSGTGKASDELSERSRRYEEDALEGVKAYLEDGYDPRLIVEQLAVLRRAQRLRRPGRDLAGRERPQS